MLSTSVKRNSRCILALMVAFSYITNPLFAFAPHDRSGGNPDFALSVSPKTKNLEDLFVPSDESVLETVRLRSSGKKDSKIFHRWPRPNANSGFKSKSAAILEDAVVLGQLDARRGRIWIVEEIHLNDPYRAALLPLLAALEHSGVRHIGLEGADFAASGMQRTVELWRENMGNKINHQSAKKLLQEKMIHPAEWTAIQPQSQIHLFGLENMDLYKEHLRCFVDSMVSAKMNDVIFRRQEMQLGQQSRAVFSPQLAALYHLTQRFEQQRYSGTSYLNALKNLSPETEFRDFLNITHFFAQDYAKINAQELIHEISLYRNRVANTLILRSADKEKAEKFWQKSLDWFFLRRAVELQFSAAEAYRLKNLATHRQEFPQPLALNLKNAVRFSDYAGQRDHAFIQNIETYRRANPNEDIAVVVGGFHSQALYAHFQKSGVPVVVVRAKTQLPFLAASKTTNFIAPRPGFDGTVLSLQKNEASPFEGLYSQTAQVEEFLYTWRKFILISAVGWSLIYSGSSFQEMKNRAMGEAMRALIRYEIGDNIKSSNMLKVVVNCFTDALQQWLDAGASGKLYNFFTDNAGVGLPSRFAIDSFFSSPSLGATAKNNLAVFFAVLFAAATANKFIDWKNWGSVFPFSWLFLRRNKTFREDFGKFFMLQLLLSKTIDYNFSAAHKTILKGFNDFVWGVYFQPSKNAMSVSIREAFNKAFAKYWGTYLFDSSGIKNSFSAQTFFLVCSAMVLWQRSNAAEKIYPYLKSIAWGQMGLIGMVVASYVGYKNREMANKKLETIRRLLWGNFKFYYRQEPVLPKYQQPKINSAEWFNKIQIFMHLKKYRQFVSAAQ